MKVQIDIPNKTAQSLIRDVLLSVDLANQIAYYARSIPMDMELLHIPTFEEIEPDESGCVYRIMVTKQFAHNWITELVRLHGADIEECDMVDYDVAFQMVAFGYVKYS